MKAITTKVWPMLTISRLEMRSSKLMPFFIFRSCPLSMFGGRPLKHMAKRIDRPPEFLKGLVDTKTLTKSLGFFHLK
jgi:hypothetical protein